MPKPPQLQHNSLRHSHPPSGRLAKNICRLIACLWLLVAGVATPLAATSQGIDRQHGTKYSPLAQVNKTNVGKLQVAWLSMPCMTATTDSPSKMMVKRPNRSGRCCASGGIFSA